MTKHKDLPPNFKRVLLEKVKSKQPFWELLGIEMVDVKKGWAKLRLPFSKSLIHPLGVVHGGAIFSLADSAVAMALLGLVGKDEEFTTVEMKINYVRSFKEGEMIAEAANQSTGSVSILIPLKGVSQLDSPGGEFWDPDANDACFRAIKDNLNPNKLMFIFIFSMVYWTVLTNSSSIFT